MAINPEVNYSVSANLVIVFFNILGILFSFVRQATSFIGSENNSFDVAGVICFPMWIKTFTLHNVSLLEAMWSTILFCN